MCNDYEQRAARVITARRCRFWSFASRHDNRNTIFRTAQDIRTNDIGPVMRAAGNVNEFSPMRLSYPPPRPRAPPIIQICGIQLADGSPLIHGEVCAEQRGVLRDEARNLDNDARYFSPRMVR